MEIIPSILEPNFSEVEEKIKKLEGSVDWVQLDVCDGKFVPSTTWQAPDDLEVLDGKIKIEVHLMTENPEEHLADWLLVADRVVIHSESTKNLSEIVAGFDNFYNKLGLSLLLSTDVEIVEPFLSKIDVVQLMAIEEIGFQGERLSERVFAKIKKLRASYPKLKIQIDGGVNLDNATRLKEAGADAVVVGSAIWQTPDLAAAIAEFQKI